jgi:hypothetical protein
MLTGLLLSSSTFGIDPPYRGPYIETDDILMVLIPHTPAQMAAFYEARGFPPAALTLISAACFVTVHIENKSRRVIWLETGNWHLGNNEKTLQRLDKDSWDARWDEIQLPAANRATFGWTLLPTQRDLQPDEPVGGNIVLGGDVKKFNLEARFLTGEDKRGGMLTLEFQDIDCPQAATAQ